MSSAIYLGGGWGRWGCSVTSSSSSSSQSLS